MLNLAALTLLTVLAGAASTREPITGAFGLEFEEPLTDAVRAASLGQPPYPLPPRNLDQSLPPPIPGEPTGWYLFVPQAVPALLDAPGVRFMVLQSRSGLPLRILAEHPAPDCTADVLWLTRSIARKYNAPDDPFGAERDGFRHSARYLSDVGQIDISCGPTLLIEYTHPAAYRSWLAAEAERHAAHRAQQGELAEARQSLDRERKRQVADLFTAGDRYRLEGALGLTFGVPVPVDWLRADVVADEPLEVEPPALADLLRDGRITVTVGPDREPVQVVGEFPDPDARRFESLAEALQAKYGSALKDTPVHKIHKISGDYLVARYVVDRAVARLVFIDDAGRERQQQRELEAKQARLAEQERQFQEETAGL